MSQVTTRPKTGTILQPKTSYHKSSNATDVSSWFYKDLRTFSEQNRLLIHIFWNLQKVYPLELKTFQSCFNIEFPGVDVEMMDHKTINKQQS
jgi:hypothetical protein